MGTNYYARKIPTKSRKDEIIKAIKNDDFDKIRNLVEYTYGTASSNLGMEYGVVHLGKASGGWKFQWNPNWYNVPLGHLETIKNEDGNKSRKWVVDDEYGVRKIYDLTKESIKAYIDQENIVIYDEYGVKQDKEEFWDMAINWGDENGMDSDTYHEKYPTEKTICYMNKYSKFIEHYGFKLTKDHSQFFSDGLVFACCTDFS